MVATLSALRREDPAPDWRKIGDDDHYTDKKRLSGYWKFCQVYKYNDLKYGYELSPVPYTRNTILHWWKYQMVFCFCL
jgi:hypothetical protein